MNNAPAPSPSSGDGYTGMPKWVKRSLLTVVAVLVVLVLVGLIVGGDHSPGRHLSAPIPADVTAHRFGYR